MQHNLAFAITAALLVATSARHASANVQWIDSAPVTNHSPACNGVATTTYMGYRADPAVGVKSGDIGYIHFVAIAGCANDTVAWEMFLQASAISAVSSQNQVYCYFNNALGVPSSVGACSQSPSIGNFKGPFYGYASLKPGQTFEIQFPVQWAAPGTIEAVMDSAVSPLTPTLTPMLRYQPYFQHLAGTSSADGTSVNVSFELDHWFTQSQVVVEYGNGVFDHSTPPFTADPMYIDYPSLTATLTGTTPGVPVTWRVRLTNQWGTFYSITEFLSPTSSVLPHNPPLCMTRFC